MLPKKLRSIYDDLVSKQSNLNKDQKILLQELKFINSNKVIEKQLDNFTYSATLTESFSAAVGSCAACGKKY